MLVWVTFDRAAVERYCIGNYNHFYCILYINGRNTGDAITSFNRRGYNGKGCYDADGLLPGHSHCGFCKFSPIGIRVMPTDYPRHSSYLFGPKLPST